MEHIPVLLEECIEGLRIKPDGIYIDGTLGRGGHTRAIAEKLTTGRIIAIDRDSEAIEEARPQLSEYADKITFVHGNFGVLSEILIENNVSAADGMLFDLGVSSPQLDKAERGFSYMQDAALDMRMDRGEELTAFDIVNTWREDRLRKILFDYGEERYAREIVRAIIRNRERTAIKTTFELNQIILESIPPKARREKQHPSKRTFQALRIAVNDELRAVAEMLESAPDKLSPGGRICVISFQSLEDRLVKNAFASRVNGCVCPRDIPVCACGFVPTLKLITRKPIVSSASEENANPRARSAKLRIAEKL